MKTKVYYLIVAVDCVILVLYLPHSASAKKNILFLVADDMGKDMMRLYTDQVVPALTDEQRAQVPPTPNLDTLAAEGITFNNRKITPEGSAV